MKSKLEYFKNNFIKDKDNIHVLNKEDSYVENFGKQWRDYKFVQIDSFNNFTISYDYLKEIFFNKLSKINNKTILEIGGGAGRFTEHFIKEANKCVSVDLSSSVYHNVSKDDKKLILVKADFNKLIPDKKFDIVFCRGVLQHTKDPIRSLLKIHKFVNKNGFVVFDIYKMPKIGYLHPKYFFWRPLIQTFIKYEKFEFFLKRKITLILMIKRIIKRIFLNSNFVSDCFIPVWDYKDALNIDNKSLENWAIMDTLDGLYAKYDYPQRNNKIVKILKKNNIKILENNKSKNYFITKL